MSAPRFFVPPPLPRTPTGRDFELPDATARHVALALRMRPGDALTLFDGTGGEFAATITRIDRRGVAAHVGRFDPVERESPHRVTLVQAVIANDPMDWAVRKAVELGVAAVQPVLAPFLKTGTAIEFEIERGGVKQAVTVKPNPRPRQTD